MKPFFYYIYYIMIENMGIGNLGGENAIFKRKFRWTFQLNDTGGAGQIIGSAGDSQSLSSGRIHFCKTAARPSFSFDEQIVQHVTEKIHIPGKPTWEAITIKVYDLQNNDSLYIWLQSFYNSTNGFVSPIAQPTDFLGIGRPKKTGILTMLDGKGNPLERWNFQGCWPLSIDWEDLDFSISDTADINIQLRYDRAIQAII